MAVSGLRVMHQALIVVGLLLALSGNVVALWPRPRTLSTGSTNLRLSSQFSINVAVHNAPQDLKDAVTRTKGFISNDKLQLLVPDRGASLAGSLKTAKQLKTLTLSLTGNRPVKSISEEAVVDLTQRDESYTLHVPNDGSSAQLSANSTLGLLRGLTTFSQLWYYLNGETYTTEAPISISDSPRYPYRGFMLDTARNYFPVSDILTTLDSLSATKINTFHWHIVDSQSFPLKLNNFPELAEAAYDSSSIYTESDVQNVVSYAAARGIDVMLEIDTPGHTAAISVSHPSFVACNNLQPWTTFANEPPAGQLRFTDKTVIQFVQSLFKSTAQLLPSTLFSTGGDEINMPCYDQDNQTQQELQANKQTFEEALSSFTQQTHSVLEGMGKTPVVWEEMVLAHNVTLSNKTIALVWISSEDASAVAAKGYRIIHAASDYFYLDCGAGGWVGNNVEGNSWCDPFKTWQKAYSFDPLANLSESQQHLVLGGEQLLWTEQSGPQNYQSIVWPRAAASAEVFWTGDNLNVSSALPRLHNFRYRLVQRGVNAINLQPEWCALRPHACDLLPIAASLSNNRDADERTRKDEEEEERINSRTLTQLPEQDVSFSTFLRNHIQLTLNNFFGDKPFIPVNDNDDITEEVTPTRDKDVPESTQSRDVDDNQNDNLEQKPLDSNNNKQKQKLEEENDQESFSEFFKNHVKKRMEDYFGAGATADIRNDNVDPERKSGGTKEKSFGGFKNEEEKETQETFSEFFKKHLKKRVEDYLVPAVLRQEQADGR